MKDKKITRAINNGIFKIKAYSPEILVVMGIVGGVTAAVMACKATTKASKLIEQSKIDKDTVKNFVPQEGDDYTEEDRQADLKFIDKQTCLKVAGAFAPSIIIGGLSITSVLASNNILRKRNVALAAAYAVLDKSFKTYRERVIDRFGDDVDKQIRMGVKPVDVEITSVDENGNTVTETKTILEKCDDVISPYAVEYNSSNVNWEKVDAYREFFLSGQQNYANDLLRTKGHLTLNEVYRGLGFEETKAGMVVGWKYDPKNPNIDSYVEFEINKVYDMHGEVESYIIDFNVDGNIFVNM